MSAIVGSTAERSAQLVTEVVVPELDRTVAFLVALGFRVERATPTFAVLRWEDAYLFVAENTQAQIEQRWVGIRIMVPSVDAMMQKVADLGGRVRTSIVDQPYGLRDFVVLAPGGLDVRFAEII
jgi:catechol 2,3-dioxygenase-like lactoylglutathione lyase family enzyme